MEQTVIVGALTVMHVRGVGVGEGDGDDEQHRFIDFLNEICLYLSVVIGYCWAYQAYHVGNIDEQQ